MTVRKIMNAVTASDTPAIPATATSVIIHSSKKASALVGVGVLVMTPRF